MLGVHNEPQIGDIMSWLTIDLDGLVSVWDSKPTYEDRRWGRTNDDVRRGVKRIIGYPQFERFASTLSLRPGEEGIFEVNLEITLILPGIK